MEQDSVISTPDGRSEIGAHSDCARPPVKVFARYPSLDADGDFDYRNKLNRIAEAEKALKEFSRKLYATSPDRAAYFPESLALLVIADMPEIDDKDDLSSMLTNENARAAFRKRSIDHQFALLLRKLSSLISHVKSELRQGAEGEVFGTSGRMAERAALDRVIAAGCRIYRTRHSKIPA